MENKRRWFDIKFIVAIYGNNRIKKIKIREELARINFSYFDVNVSTWVYQFFFAKPNQRF